jgi:secondary thiamine-phosphate synthase enzyme
MDKFSISTKGRNDVIDITSQVGKVVKKSNVKEGICLISCPGSTCGITTIEYEPNLIRDFKEFLEKLVPSDKDYHHDKTWGEKNGQSHLLSALIKPFLFVPIEDGKSLLGQWQQIVFCDFDSRTRERTINVLIIDKRG